MTEQSTAQNNPKTRQNVGLWSLMTWKYWRSVDMSSKTKGVSMFDLIGSTFLINVLGLAMPVMMLQIYDRILPNEGTATLSFLAIGVMIAVLCDAGLRIARAYLTARAGAVHDHALSTHLMEKTFKVSQRVFGQKSVSDRLNQLQSSSKLREFYSGQSFLTLLDLPFSLIFLGAIAFIGGAMVVVPITAIALIAIVTKINISRSKDHASQSGAFEKMRMNAVMQTLKNIETVKGQAMENVLMRSYETNKAEHGKVEYRLGQYNLQGAAFGQAIVTLSLVATAALGAYFVMNGLLTIGGVAACVLLCGRSIQPAQKAISLLGRIRATRGALSSIEDVLHYPEQKKVIVPSATAADAIGQVHMRQLGFTYKKDVPPLFKDISLSVQPGEAIAIQGDTGSGKSTLLSLLMGLYKPTQGKITLDGYQPHRIDQSLLYPGVAYLPQHPNILHGTILENITLFREETHRQQARHVAQILGLDDAVLKLPHGYNTVIGKGKASPLPDGMLKRIAIARALLDPTRLILFDEADSFLDVQGRNQLYGLMKDLIGKCTLIMVSKNSSIFHLTNRCYRLEDGTLTPFARNNIMEEKTVSNKILKQKGTKS